MKYVVDSCQYEGEFLKVHMYFSEYMFMQFDR